MAAATEIHHRKFRSRGGTHDPSNLIHLCGFGNHTGCHGIAHSERGHELGWSVHSWDEPARVPVRYPDGSWWLLDHSGGREEVRGNALVQGR